MLNTLFVRLFSSPSVLIPTSSVIVPTSCSTVDPLPEPSSALPRPRLNMSYYWSSWSWHCHSCWQTWQILRGNLSDLSFLPWDLCLLHILLMGLIGRFFWHFNHCFKGACWKAVGHGKRYACLDQIDHCILEPHKLTIKCDQCLYHTDMHVNTIIKCACPHNHKLWK